jgi:hypothetical protein
MKNELRRTIMENMRKQGYSLRVIGETFNVSHEAVRKILDRKVDNAKLSKKGRTS